MERLASLGLLITCALAIYVGGRTLGIWWRTRQVQEFAIGANVLSIALGAMVLTAFGALGSSANADAPLAPRVLGSFLLGVHVVATFGGTWKIFRPLDTWALTLTGCATLLVAGWFLVGTLDPGGSAARSAIYQGMRGAGMAWAAFECFRYSGKLQRRVALGLAEPMVAHRIWLWGVGASASLFTIGLDLVTLLSTGASLVSTSAGLNVTSVVGVIGTGSIALAFFPPRVYENALLRRSAA
jgi:hypothetical protein